MRLTWERRTTDGVICTAPSMVGSIIVTPDGAQNVADLTLHDGESAQDPQILQIRSSAGTNKVINFTPYLETKRGLYLDITSNVAEVLIQLFWKDE